MGASGGGLCGKLSQLPRGTRDPASLSALSWTFLVYFPHQFMRWHSAQMEPDWLRDSHWLLEWQGAGAASCRHLSTSLKPRWTTVPGLRVGRRRNSAAHSLFPPTWYSVHLYPAPALIVDSMKKGAQNLPLCFSILEWQWPPPSRRLKTTVGHERLSHSTLPTSHAEPRESWESRGPRAVPTQKEAPDSSHVSPAWSRGQRSPRPCPAASPGWPHSCSSPFTPLPLPPLTSGPFTTIHYLPLCMGLFPSVTNFTIMFSECPCWMASLEGMGTACLVYCCVPSSHGLFCHIR